MHRRSTRLGSRSALVLDEVLLEALDLDAETELEVWTDGDVLVVTPVRDRRRRSMVHELVSQAHEEYAGVFRRLAE